MCASLITRGVSPPPTCFSGSTCSCAKARRAMPSCECWPETTDTVRHLRISIAIALALLVVIGGPALHGEIGTLAENKQLPGREIKEFMARADWEYTSARKIARFVAVRAVIRPDSSV